MFEIGLTIGWAAIMILLLCIRADIRELSVILKESRETASEGEQTRSTQTFRKSHAGK